MNDNYTLREYKAYYRFALGTVRIGNSLLREGKINRSRMAELLNDVQWCRERCMAALLYGV